MDILYWVIRIIFWPDRFQRLTPNELGDFLAGAFAPLAFFWLIVAVWLQQRELTAQHSSLNLQADELKNSVEQLKQQTEIMQQQLKIADQERTRRILESEYLIVARQFRDVATGLSGRHKIESSEATVYAEIVDVEQISDCISERNFPGIFDGFVHSVRMLKNDHGIDFLQILRQQTKPNRC